MKTGEVLLGYEVGTGHPVAIPIRHMAVTGQTQESGKTTTLEALVARSGVRALAFVTKRGEGAFADAHRVQPYFRDRADWQFVDQLLSATLNEKNKFLRPWIIKICRNTRTLADVLAAVRKAHGTAKGISEGVYTQLEAYLELIVPEIAGADLASTLALRAGLNVMDVSGFDVPMQMLFVQSAIDWVNSREEDTVVVIPEAWEFIPEGKGSPVKASAVALVRKGAALGNRIWVDSQDMAGVDKTILRGCTVWLIGVQREANEIKRNLSNIPAGLAKPKASDVALLEKGQFYACHGQNVVKTYVRPVWATEADGIGAAINGSIARAERPKSVLHKVENREAQVDEKEARALREENKNLVGMVHTLQRELDELKNKERARQTPAAPAPATAAIASTGQPICNMDEIYAELMRRISADPVLIRLATEKPAIEVQVKRRTITMDGTSLRGRVARLIAKGFFDDGSTQGGCRAELRRTGPDVNTGNLSKAFSDFVSDGFLTLEGGGTYRSVEGMKVNVVEAA